MRGAECNTDHQLHALCSSESHRKGFHQRSPIRSKRINVTKLANKRGDDTTGGHSLHEVFQEDALKRAQTA